MLLSLSRHRQEPAPLQAWPLGCASVLPMLCHQLRAARAPLLLPTTAAAAEQTTEQSQAALLLLGACSTSYPEQIRLAGLLPTVNISSSFPAPPSSFTHTLSLSLACQVNLSGERHGLAAGQPSCQQEGAGAVNTGCLSRGQPAVMQRPAPPGEGSEITAPTRYAAAPASNGDPVWARGFIS